MTRPSMNARPMRFIMYVVAVSLAASCTAERGQDPDAQQLARINNELAALTAQVSALARRLDSIEGKGDSSAAVPETTPAPAPGLATPGVRGAAEANAAAKRPPSPGSDQLTVILSGGIELDGNRVSNDELSAALREHARRDKDAQIIIHVGPMAPHGRLMEIIDLAKASGINNLALRNTPLASDR